MKRGLLAATALLTLAGCASTGRPPPAVESSTVQDRSGRGTAPAASHTGISSEDAARLAPLAPARVTAVAEAGGVRLSWTPTGEDIAYYECLRRRPTDPRWQVAGRAGAQQQTFLDPAPPSGGYVYGVVAVRSSGLASTVTESQPVTIG